MQTSPRRSEDIARAEEQHRLAAEDPSGAEVGSDAENDGADEAPASFASIRRAAERLAEMALGSEAAQPPRHTPPLESGRACPQGLPTNSMQTSPECGTPRVSRRYNYRRSRPGPRPRSRS